MANFYADITRQGLPQDDIQKLNTYSEVLNAGTRQGMVVECTGLGKTARSVVYVKEKAAEGKKCLFLVRDSRMCAQLVDAMQEYPSVLVMTYNRFWNGFRHVASSDVVVSYGHLKDRLIEVAKEQYAGIDFAVFDEALSINAERWSLAVRALIDAFPEMRYIGLSPFTHTSDGDNVLRAYFDDNILSQESLGDAIVAGKVCAPVVCTGFVSPSTLTNDNVDMLVEKAISGTALEVYKKELCMSRRNDLTTTANRCDVASRRAIKELIEEYRNDEPSYKFIVYMSDIESCTALSGLVAELFKDAVKGFSPELRIMNSGLSSAENASAEAWFNVPEDNKIKLLLTVNMMSESVHPENLTGEVFLNPMHSFVRFQQQLGRCICRDKSKHPLIFDFACNYESTSRKREKAWNEKPSKIITVHEAKKLVEKKQKIKNPLMNYTIVYKYFDEMQGLSTLLRAYTKKVMVIPSVLGISLEELAIRCDAIADRLRAFGTSKASVAILGESLFNFLSTILSARGKLSSSEKRVIKNHLGIAL